jgi:hypothetical protein
VDHVAGPLRILSAEKKGGFGLIIMPQVLSILRELLGGVCLGTCLAIYYGIFRVDKIFKKIMVFRNLRLLEVGLTQIPGKH